MTTPRSDDVPDPVGRFVLDAVMRPSVRCLRDHGVLVEADLRPGQHVMRNGVVVLDGYSSVFGGIPEPELAEAVWGALAHGGEGVVGPLAHPLWALRDVQDAVETFLESVNDWYVEELRWGAYPIGHELCDAVSLTREGWTRAVDAWARS